MKKLEKSIRPGYYNTCLRPRRIVFVDPKYKNEHVRVKTPQKHKVEVEESWVCKT